MQTIFCNNCGDRGHAFRECKKPVLSCGIILLRNRETPLQPAQLPLDVNNVELLMIRRKDSMSYTEFMRGKYDTTDYQYVLRLLENMTSCELSALRSQPFEALWARMWNNADKHEHEMPFAKEKFISVSHLLTSAKSVYPEPEWGFPKGRRYRCESDVQCAQREFFEETNIPRNAYILVKDVEFKETFLGTNGIPYEHKYFLAILTQPSQFNLHQKFTCIQKREISAIGWKTMSDCMMLTRPHYTGREQMLIDLSLFVGTVEVRIPNIPAVDNGNTRT